MSTWDAVWLNDEVDLLAWRITLLREVVDHVLVVEGDRVFTGAAKRSAFLDNEARLRSLTPSLHHVVVPLDPHAAQPWDRENQQRRGMAAALHRLAKEGDVVFVCDVDEVPRPVVVEKLARALDRPVRLHMTHANYYANWVQEEPWRNSAWAFRLGQEQNHQMLRVHLGEPHSDWEGYVEDYVPDAGWHLSFMGGEEAIRRKWAAYSHQEHNTDLDRWPGHLERCFRYGVHFTGRLTLTKLPVVEPQLATLARVRPDFFRFEPAPSRRRARAFATWTWLRKRRIPAALRQAVDDSDRLLFALSPLLLLAGLVARARRRLQRKSWPPERRWTESQPPSQTERRQ